MSHAEPTSSLRFDCPACGVTLTVPPSAAGVQGPCPKCWQEIVSPDPARGILARLVQLPAAAPVIPPEPPAPPPIEPPPAPTEVAAPPVVEPYQPAIPSRPTRIGWLVPSLLSAVVFAGTGYYLGKSQRPVPDSEPLLTDPPAPLASAPEPGTPSVPEPKAEPVIPPAPAKPVEEAPLPAPPPPPTPERLSADAALKGFLEAPTWKSRVEFVIFPDDMRASMEKRAAELGDGPIQTTSVSLSPKNGPAYIYIVCTPSIPEGFPVAVFDTPDGAKVNWESFVNFHDDLFRKFAEGPAGAKGIFQVLAKIEPPATGEAESYFVRFRLSPPMTNRQQYAWMKKNSVALAQLRGIFDGTGKYDKATVDKMVAEGGVPLALALTKRQANDGQVFIEITDVVRLGWGPTEE